MLTLVSIDGDACALSGGKAELVRYYKAKRVKQFRWHGSKGLHNATDYARWVEAKAPYEVAFTRYYEPWGIMLRCSFCPL